MAQSRVLGARATRPSGDGLIKPLGRTAVAVVDDRHPLLSLSQEGMAAGLDQVPNRQPLPQSDPLAVRLLRKKSAVVMYQTSPPGASLRETLK